MTPEFIKEITTTLGQLYGDTPMLRAFGRDPFQFLVAVMLSARSRDAMTIPVAQSLFKAAPTPQDILLLTDGDIEGILRPIGFYRTKTRYLKGLSHRIITVYGGSVPDTFDDLITFPGVSRKVANVVLAEIFHKNVIAVDTHVHRISNRLGWVSTTTVEDTEKELMSLLPPESRRTINGQLVQHGQNICLPRHPRCTVCPISLWCPKINVL